MKTLLIVDDESSVVESLRYVLKESYKIIGVNSGKEALQVIDREHIDLMLLDLIMPEMDGMEVLKRLQPMNHEIGVVVLTAVHDVKSIVGAVKLGALDYIVKPFGVEEIKLAIQKALKFRNLSREVRYLRSECRSYFVDRIIHGHSKIMEGVIDTISRVSRVNATVLLSGESGTGKELVARAIHFDSNRRDKPFVVVSCPNLAGELLESELFGHEKGSFTGAYERKAGKFEIAEGGTIFLDEISEMSLLLQSKLLRVLQEKEFSRIGGHSFIKADVRIIAATNKDLESKIREGLFREDLYYRINVVPIYIPPLRERPEDISQLVEHFYKIYRKECHAKSEFISREAMELLLAYHWPGNVRELKNVIERAIALYGNEPVLLPEHLPAEIAGIPCTFQKPIVNENERVCLEDEIARIEKQLIEHALQKAGGVKSRAAKLLGTTRSVIHYKMQKYGIEEITN
ncbi:MAG: sigma-54-dependent Fis family transcriptional regulator [Candidatus Kuenenia sp.]|nr:sigma-54-dependent Fis family transcriptional regulator [Candidatus Kuenenia hertensis]